MQGHLKQEHLLVLYPRPRSGRHRGLVALEGLAVIPGCRGHRRRPNQGPRPTAASLCPLELVLHHKREVCMCCRVIVSRCVSRYVNVEVIQYRRKPV